MVVLYTIRQGFNIPSERAIFYILFYEQEVNIPWLGGSIYHGMGQYSIVVVLDSQFLRYYSMGRG